MSDFGQIIHQRASSIGNKSEKFQLNLPMQMIVTATVDCCQLCHLYQSFATVCLILTVSMACWEIPR